MRSLTASELTRLDPVKLRRPGAPVGGAMFKLADGRAWTIPAPKLSVGMTDFPNVPRGVRPEFDEGPMFAAAAEAFADADAAGSQPGKWLALSVAAAVLLTRDYDLPFEVAHALLPFAPTDQLAALVRRAIDGDHAASNRLADIGDIADAVAEVALLGPARELTWVSERMARTN